MVRLVYDPSFAQQTLMLSRDSINSLAGTMISSNLPVVSNQRYGDIIINNVISMIFEKWLIGVNGSKKVYNQHNKARSSHFGSDSILFQDAATLNRWIVKFAGQPENSQDMSINDLSIFRAYLPGLFGFGG